MLQFQQTFAEMLRQFESKIDKTLETLEVHLVAVYSSVVIYLYK